MQDVNCKYCESFKKMKQTHAFIRFDFVSLLKKVNVLSSGMKVRKVAALCKTQKFYGREKGEKKW